MRKFLFYTWCIGAMIAYGSIVRWIVRSIAEDYGIAVMAIAVLIWIGACLLMAHKIDKADAIAAAKLTGYMPGSPQEGAVQDYLSSRDDSKA